MKLLLGLLLSMTMTCCIVQSHPIVLKKHSNKPVTNRQLIRQFEVLLLPVFPLLLPIVATPIVKDLLPTKFGDIFHLAILILYKKWHDKIIHSLETKSQELNIIEVQIDELLLELEQSAEEFNLDD